MAQATQQQQTQQQQYILLAKIIRRMPDSSTHYLGAFVFDVEKHMTLKVDMNMLYAFFPEEELKKHMPKLPTYGNNKTKKVVLIGKNSSHYIIFFQGNILYYTPQELLNLQQQGMEFVNFTVVHPSKGDVYFKLNQGSLVQFNDTKRTIPNTLWLLTCYRMLGSADGAPEGEVLQFFKTKEVALREYNAYVTGQYLGHRIREGWVKSENKSDDGKFYQTEFYEPNYRSIDFMIYTLREISPVIKDIKSSLDVNHRIKNDEYLWRLEVMSSDEDGRDLMYSYFRDDAAALAAYKEEVRSYRTCDKPSDWTETEDVQEDYRTKKKEYSYSATHPGYSRRDFIHIRLTPSALINVLENSYSYKYIKERERRQEEAAKAKANKAAPNTRVFPANNTITGSAMPPQKVYMVQVDATIDMEPCGSIYHFRDLEKAKACYIKEYKEAKKRAKIEGWTIDEEKTTISVYEEGYYSNNHIDVSLEEVKFDD